MSIIIKLKKYLNIFVTTLWIIQIYINENVGKSCINYRIYNIDAQIKTKCWYANQKWKDNQIRNRQYLRLHFDN